MMKSTRLSKRTYTDRQLPAWLALLVLLTGASTAFSALQAHDSITGPLDSRNAANLLCIGCHRQENQDVGHSVHGVVTALQAAPSGTDLSRFALPLTGTVTTCTTCHRNVRATSGAQDQGPAQAQADCLACHDTLQSREADLLTRARNAGMPGVNNCLQCHGQTCGVDPLPAPPVLQDIHIQRYGFSCQSCHRNSSGKSHVLSVAGRENAQSPDHGCVSCHGPMSHELTELNRHAKFLACQSCHIPATKFAGRVVWNWILAVGKRLSGGAFTGLENAFVQGKGQPPAYLWYDGTDKSYHRGEKISPDTPVILRGPGPRTSMAKIFPFRVWFTIQPYDVKFRFLLSPSLEGKHIQLPPPSRWTEMFKKGMRDIRLPYSGEYAMTTTIMYIPLNHGVRGASEALDCLDCHGNGSRMNWQRLGYERDPWQQIPQPQPARLQPPQFSLPPVQETILPEMPAR